jgi:hypothetical protein
MRFRFGRWLTALVAAAVLAGAAGAASARRISLTSQGFRVVFTSFAVFESWLVIEPRCPVTFEGSFHSRTISKVANSLIGYITRAIADQSMCAEGRLYMLNGAEVLAGLTVSNSLPWHIRYSSFVGTLPFIQEIKVSIVGMGVLAERFGGVCLYLTTAEAPARARLARESGGLLTSLTMEEFATIPLHTGVGCPSTVTFRGTSGQPTVPNRPEGITAVLVA